MPLTVSTSEPMLDFFDRPLIDVMLRLFQEHGISKTDILSEKELLDVREYFSKAPYETLETNYRITAFQQLKIDSPNISESYLLFHDIVVTDINLTKAIQFHNSHTNPVTVVIPTPKKEESTDFETIETTAQKLQTNPFPKECFFLIRPPFCYSKEAMEQGKFPLTAAPDTPVSVLYLPGYFRILSSFEDYQDILKESLENRWLMSPYQTNNGVVLNENTFIEVGAKIKPPVYLGKNVSIKKDAEILPYSIICRHSEIGENAKVSNSILLADCHIMKNASVTEALLCNHCTVEENTVVAKSSCYGAYSRIVNSDSDNQTPISTYKKTEFFDRKQLPFFIPNENPSTYLFTLGAVCQQVFENGVIGIFTDDTALAELYSHSLHAGLLHCGISLYEFPPCTLSMCKSACPFYHLKAGFYLYEENKQAKLFILDKNGCVISDTLWETILCSIKNYHAHPLPEKAVKATVVSPYQIYYYPEITRRLGSHKTKMQLTVESDSLLIQEYARKIASCHQITVYEEKRPGVIRFSSNGAGTQYTIYDENNHPLTKRQLEIITAILMTEECENQFATTILTPEIIRQILLKKRFDFLETENNLHSIDTALMNIPEQLYLTYDPIYLMMKILFFLVQHNKTLVQWVSSLPKSFVIEKSVIYKEQLTDAIANLIHIANNNYTEENGQYKIRTKKGITLVKPEQNRLIITSESTREEYAQELTDFFISQYKNNSDQA